MDYSDERYSGLPEALRPIQVGEWPNREAESTDDRNTLRELRRPEFDQRELKLEIRNRIYLNVPRNGMNCHLA